MSKRQELFKYTFLLHRRLFGELGPLGWIVLGPLYGLTFLIHIFVAFCHTNKTPEVKT